MSKPEFPGSQSLEEILATIRKTLADDRPDEGLSKLDALQAAQEGAPAAANGAGTHRRDTLHERLVVGLEGVASGHAEEDNLSDLLASEAPMPVRNPKPQADVPDTRDPPWFLPREPAAAEAKPAAARAEPVAPDKPEEIALTRPETLRRSFPPLFGGGETTPARPADLPFEPAKPVEAPLPTPPRAPEAPVLRTPAAASPEPPAAAVASAAVQDPVAEAAKAFAAIEARFRPARPEPPVAVAAVAAAPEPPVVVATVAVARETPAAKAEIAPAVVAEIAPEAEPEDVADAKAEPAAGLENQPLQEVIARLLEPVIQQWLDANLPRMVEAAIREEVGRQMRGPRGEQKI